MLPATCPPNMTKTIDNQKRPSLHSLITLLKRAADEVTTTCHESLCKLNEESKVGFPFLQQNPEMQQSFRSNSTLATAGYHLGVSNSPTSLHASPSYSRTWSPDECGGLCVVWFGVLDFVITIINMM